jgi:N-acetylneuraminic acid mutarotase
MKAINETGYRQRARDSMVGGRIGLLAVLLVFGSFSCRSAVPAAEQLPPLPDVEGFAGGFAGVSNGRLLFAGGANFPNGRPWEGGKKVWYDRIFILDASAGQWANGGTLPHPLGYGVSVTWRDRVVCAGGSNADRHFADCFSMRWSDGAVVIEALPSLPMPIANLCGALVGDTLYVAGGSGSPSAVAAMNRCFCLDLTHPGTGWHEIDSCPGVGRMLAIAAGDNDSFWVMGGIELTAGVDGKPVRRYLSDAYRYQPGKGWSRVADLPSPIAAGPSPAPVWRNGPVLLGGDDGSQVNAAPDQHRGFSARPLHYDPVHDHWVDEGPLPFARATAPTALWQGRWIVASGEIRPGIRSNQVWAVRAGVP